MRPNPFRLTLAILGIGLLVLGGVLWLSGVAIPVDPDTGEAGNGPALVAIGRFLLGSGWVPVTGWLVVRALQWVPKPPTALDTRSEEEIREFLQKQRDPDAAR